MTNESSIEYSFTCWIKHNKLVNKKRSIMGFMFITLVIFAETGLYTVMCSNGYCLHHRIKILKQPS